MEANEDLFAGMIRESNEELSINLLREDLDLVHTLIRYIDGTNDRIDFFFTAAKWGGMVTNMEPEKCSELSWLDLDNSKIIPHIKNVLVSIEKGIEYSSEGFKN